MAEITKWIVSKLMLRRALAYKRLFRLENGEISNDARTVLADLTSFCFGADSTHVPGDPHSSARNAGRQEVLHRMMLHLNLDLSRVSELKQQEGDLYD